MGLRATLLVVVLGVAGCAGFLGLAEDDPSSFGAPTEFRTYVHDLRYVTKDCAGHGRCVGYTLRWPAKTRVVLELHPDGFPGVLLIDDVPYEAGEDGVVRAEFVTRREKTARVVVAGRRLGDEGPLKLIVGPPPVEEVALPAPPPTPAELEAARAEAAKREQEELAAFVAGETKGYRVEKPVHRGDFAEPAPILARVRRGRCYKVLLVAEDTAEIPGGWLSPYLQFEWPGWSFGRGLDRRTKESRRGHASEELCPFRNGKVEVQWKAQTNPDRAARGPYRVELWARTISTRDLKALEQGKLAEHHEAGCRSCRAEAAECLSAGRAGCQTGFATCLKREGVPKDRCD